MINREALYVALWAKLKNVAGVVTFDRVLRHWNDVKHQEQPALFLVSGNETPKAALGRPTVWNLSASVFMYARTEKGTIPATILNGLADALELALAPDVVTGKQNLGGLCHHCYLTGIEHDEGLLGQQGVAIASITIEAV